MLTATGTFELFSAAGSYGWILRDGRNAAILAVSSGYLTREAAIAHIERLRVVAITADIIDLP